MAKGQKYNQDIKERAYAMFAANGNMSYISRHLGVPRSTLRGWKAEYDKESEQDEVLAKLRHLKKEEFVIRAWQAVNLSQTLLERRLKRALESEDAIDELLDLVAELTRDVRMSEKQRSELLSKIDALRCEDIGKLVSVIGTMYDKQALANREATEIVDGTALIRKFEDFEEEEGSGSNADSC